MRSALIRRALPKLLLAGALATLVACGGTNLGTETVGKNVNAAQGRSVRVISPSDRRDRPVFEGPTLDGGTLKSSELKGSVVVVNFWASWCSPCRIEQKALEKSYEAYKDRGVRFVGINFRDPDKAAAHAYLSEFKVTYPSIYDPDSHLAAPFRVFAPPSTYVLDAQGRVAARIIGATTTEADLNSVLDEVLAS